MLRPLAIAAVMAGAPALAASAAATDDLGLGLDEEPVALDASPAGFECVILPDDVVEVSSGANGLIESVEVERSDVVRSGQVVARLESGVEVATVDLARERAGLESGVNLRREALSYDQRRQERSRTLHDRNVISSEDLDRTAKEAAMALWRLREAEDKQRLAALELRRAEALLALRTVRSPIDGVVLERFKSPGEYVEEEPILRVARLDPLRVEVIVPVGMRPGVAVGMQAEITAETDTATPRRATVTLVDPVADPASGTFGVRLELANPGNALLAGINCTALFLDQPVPVAASEPEPVPVTSPAPEDEPAPGPVLVADAEPESGPPEPPPPAAAAEPEPVAELFSVEAPPEPAATAEQQPAPPVEEQDGAAADAFAAAAPELGSGETDGEAPDQCFVTEPVPSPDEAAALAAALVRAGATARVEATEAAPAGYIVLARQPPDSSARVMAAELRARGVEDIAPIPRGRRAGRISLGVYATVARAERRRAALAELGVSTEIERLSEPASELRIAIEPPDADWGAWQRALAEAAPELGVHPAPCGGMLAARG